MVKTPPLRQSIILLVAQCIDLLVEVGRAGLAEWAGLVYCSGRRLPDHVTAAMLSVTSELTRPAMWRI